MVSCTRGFPSSSIGSSGDPGFSKILESTFLLRVDGIFVGQLDGLEIDSGMVGMTGWKSSGVSSAGSGSKANVAQDMHTKIASAQVMKRGNKEFNGCTIFGVKKFFSGMLVTTARHESKATLQTVELSKKAIFGSLMWRI